MRSSVVEFWRGLPLTCVSTRRVFGKSFAGTAIGPFWTVSFTFLKEVWWRFLPLDRTYLVICQCKIVCDPSDAHGQSCR